MQIIDVGHAYPNPNTQNKTQIVRIVSDDGDVYDLHIDYAKNTYIKVRVTALPPPDFSLDELERASNMTF